MGGTRVREPDEGPGVVEIDSADVTVEGEARRRQRIVLAGNGDASGDASVLTSNPDENEPGLVVRVAGDSKPVDLRVDGAPVTDTNPLPTKAWLFDGTGQLYDPANRLPVDIGTVEIQATFDSVISTVNTTTTPLMAHEVFVGQWEEVTDYSAISFAIATDQGTPYGGAQAQFSVDGVNVTTVAYTTLGDGGGSAYFTIAPQARFFRIHYTNDGDAQGYLFAEVTYHFNPPGVLQAPLGAPTDDASTVQSAKSFLHGRHSSGFWAALKSTIDGILSVNVENILRSRGENVTTTGVLTAAAPLGAVQNYVAGPGQTALLIEVPEGHESTQIRLHGTFSAGSRVFFEGSADGTDDSWFALNQRRNTTALDNSEFTLLDAAPYGGPFPAAGNSNWRGSPGGVRFFRVRCGEFQPGDAISVRVTTSTAGGPIFQQGPPPLPTDSIKTGQLNNPGDTIVLNTVGTAGWSAIMQGQFSGTIRFEQTVDGTTWRPINGAVAGIGSLQSFLTGTSVPNQVLSVRGSSGGLARIRLRADNDFQGTFTGTLRAGAGSAGVFLTAPVPVAGLSAGAQTRRFSVGTSAQQIDIAPLGVRTTVEVLYQATGAANNGVVYVGFGAGVTAANGRALQPGEAWTLDLTSATPLFAIASAAGQQVQVTEIG